MTTGLAALIGLLLGHTLDLLFDRLYTDAPLTGSIYRCPHCRERLRPAHLIPLLGVVWSRGRCPDCRRLDSASGRRLPLRAFLLAPGSAALFVATELVIDDFGPALLAGAFATIFLALTFTDLERRLIPNRVVYPALLAAAAFSWAWPETSVVEIFGGGLTALAITAVMFVLGRGAFGMGDVKMSVLMGLVVGLPSVIVGVVVGVFAAGAFVLPLLLLRVVGRRDYIAYGPFIAVGAIVAILWGDSIWDWYVDR